MEPSAILTAQAATYLHVLVIGAQGAGKSTLVRHALGLEYLISAHPQNPGWSEAPGQSSLRNPRLILHELVIPHSPARTSRIQQAGEFIRCNRADGSVESQVHAIWLCVPVPFDVPDAEDSNPNNNLNALLPAEIEFLLSEEVPVVVVFTQFDNLLSHMEDQLSLPDNATDEDTDALTSQRAEIRYQETCLDILASSGSTRPFIRTSGLENDIQPAESQRTIRKLLEMTCALGDDYVERKQWALSAGPSLQTAAKKIEVSIQMALNVYYSVLFDSRISSGSLERITDKLHRQITRIWKLDDPFVRRDSEQFILGVRRISSFSQDYWSQNKSWTNILDRYQVLITLILGSSVSMTLGHAIAAFVVCLWIAQIIFRMLHRIPETLRAFLEYTIHLTLLLDRIFLNSLTSPSPSAQSTRAQPHALSAEDIERALQEYTTSQAAAQVHSEVQLFMDHTCESTWRMCRGLGRRRAEELVRELVWKWRTDAWRGPTARR